jgi:hypothetical protein
MKIKSKIDHQGPLADTARGPHADQEPGFARKGREVG